MRNPKFNSLPPKSAIPDPKMNVIVISAYEDEEELKDKSQLESPPKLLNQTRSGFHLKKKSDLHSTGKEESDIIRSYL